MKQNPDMNPTSKLLTEYYNETMPVWHDEMNKLTAVVDNKVRLNVN